MVTVVTVPEVGAAADVPLLDRRRRGGCASSTASSRMRVRNVELADDDLRVDAGLVDAPEHFDDAPDRAARGASASA